MTKAKTSEGGLCELLAFLVGGQEFCIDVMVVREIRVWTPATPVPHSPGFVCGVINLRGSVLPIIDLDACLGGASTEPSSRHAILVVESGAKTVGLLVEGVSEILTVKSDLVQDTPELCSPQARRFVTGIIACDGRMISVIALDAVLPDRNAEVEEFAF